MRQPDPVRAWLRDARARRRVGKEAVCAICGVERRPYALISGYTPPRCFRCDRLAHRRPPYERNHVFGRHNSALTIRYPVNDHRAIFSVKQLDWTPETLENPHDDPLLGSIARVEGLDDNVQHMLADMRAQSAKVKHVYDLLKTKYGPDWLPKLEGEAARVKRKAAKGMRKA